MIIDYVIGSTAYQLKTTYILLSHLYIKFVWHIWNCLLEWRRPLIGPFIRNELCLKRSAWRLKITDKSWKDQWIQKWSDGSYFYTAEDSDQWGVSDRCQMSTRRGQARGSYFRRRWLRCEVSVWATSRAQKAPPSSSPPSEVHEARARLWPPGPPARQSWLSETRADWPAWGACPRYPHLPTIETLSTLHRLY